MVNGEEAYAYVPPCHITPLKLFNEVHMCNNNKKCHNFIIADKATITMLLWKICLKIYLIPNKI